MYSTHNINALKWKLFTVMAQSEHSRWIPCAHMLSSTKDGNIVAAVSSGVLLAATVGVRHEAVPRSSRMRLSVSIEAKHTLPSIRLSITAYLRHATVGP